MERILNRGNLLELNDLILKMEYVEKDRIEHPIIPANARIGDLIRGTLLQQRSVKQIEVLM